ncbi:MAG: hypothetical protein KKB63_15615 [Alphaproteobacteria bacterium]|nr:hypothetical protein [Alphaproteobacteria bacterium]
MSISGIGSTYTPPIGGAQTESQRSGKPAAGPSAQEDFLAYMQKTPAERMREAILGDMNLTEEQLQSMESQERLKIEQQIRETIKAKIEESTEKRTGLLLDMSV